MLPAVEAQNLNYWTAREVPVLFCLFFKLINLFLAALGLHCCAQAFSSCSELGLFFVAVRGLLIEAASLVVEHGL